MRLVFPIGYAVHARRIGKKSHRPYRFSENVSVDIREVEPEEAPIAVRWRTPETVERKFVSRDFFLTCCDETRTSHTRWFKGRHWLRYVESHLYNPSTSGTSGMAARELTPEQLNRSLAAGGIYTYNNIGLSGFTPKWAGIYTKELDADPSDEFDSVIMNQRPAAMLAAEGLRDNLIVVDGVVYVACAQPGLRDIPDDMDAPVVETRSSMLDGFGGYMDRCRSGALDDIDLSSRIADASALPEVLCDESIDPDIVAMRNVDNLFKETIREISMPLEMHAEIRDRYYRRSSDFVEVSLERLELLRGIILRHAPKWQTGAATLKDIFDAIDEIRDNQTIDIRVGGSRPFP